MTHRIDAVPALALLKSEWDAANSKQASYLPYFEIERQAKEARRATVLAISKALVIEEIPKILDLDIDMELRDACLVALGKPIEEV